MLRAHLQGLPPATVITADVNPLLSEGAAYAQKLIAAGVRVDYRNYPGVTHEFFGMGAVLDDAKQAGSQPGGARFTAGIWKLSHTGYAGVFSETVIG